MGLKFPADYQQWRAWERSKHRVRNAKAAVVGRLRPQPPVPFQFYYSAENPEVLAALDVVRGTSVEALLAPLTYLSGSAAIVCREQLPDTLLPAGWQHRELVDLAELPSSVRHILSAGSFEAVSLPLHDWARRSGAQFNVVQHGLLTPFAPPLPASSHLLAWSQADAEFWSAGRDDITTSVVGSQLLWSAAQQPVALRSHRPVFLGQLHGTELRQCDVAKVSADFCRREADYRPHPGERDLVSRLYHQLWRRTGVSFDDSNEPLKTLGRPVVSIFSTGLLEAAAQGLPTWAYHPAPPDWLSELWERYNLGLWGKRPTGHVALQENPGKSVATFLEQ